MLLNHQNNLRMCTTPAVTAGVTATTSSLIVGVGASGAAAEAVDAAWVVWSVGQVAGAFRFLLVLPLLILKKHRPL